MNDLHKATEILKKGGIVIFPTDTAYGIGCRMDSKKAVKRLFEIRKRPLRQAVPVLVDSIVMAEKYLLSPLPDNVRHLMEKYWPGALTIVYPCKLQKVPSLVRGGTDKLGVRMPNHKLVLDLIKSVKVPILGPSANFHGFPTPYDCENLDKKLVKLVDYVIKGKCLGKKVSTVIDYSTISWKIIRQGAAVIEELRIKNYE
jgi:L-threonylcarbamoyladenylate synthase